MTRKLKRPIAFLMSLAMVMAMLLNFPAGVLGSDGNVTFTALDGTTGTQAYSDDEDYPMLIDGKYSGESEEDYSKWCVGDFNSSTGAYIVFKASAAVKVNGYTIVTGNDNAENAGRNPKDWTLYGCNDYSEESKTGTWEVIHSVTGDTKLEDKNYTGYDYSFTETTKSYQYFKLHVSKISSTGDNCMQMSEFILSYSTCEHVLTKTGEAEPDCINGGYDKYNCSKCGSTILKPNGKEALGHDFVEHFCTRCHEPEPADCDENGIYQISDRRELEWFAYYVNKGNTDIDAVLTADIRMNGDKKVLKDDGTLNTEAALESFTPVGSEAKPYTGKFDGQGHVISGLYLDDYSENQYNGYAGLFLVLEEGGEISNVGIEDSYFKSSNTAGGICAINDEGTITNCYNEGTIDGVYGCGGVCGYNDGIIANCYNEGRIEEYQYSGGVCGYNDYDVVNCYNNVTECKISAVGENSAADALNMTGTQFENGEVAYLLSQGCKIYTGSDEVISVDGSIWGQEIGKDKHPVFNGPKVYATKGCVTYNNDGDETEKEHNVAEGKCKDCGTYMISNEEQLKAFAAAVNNGETTLNALLTADVTLSNGGSDTWSPIGNSEKKPYNGTFDGQGHIISGLISTAGGLFGYVGTKGTICSLGVKSGISGSNLAYGICLINGGRILNCYATGTLDSVRYVGGICICNAGIIANCYGSVAVNGSNESSGICLLNVGIISNSYYDNVVCTSPAIWYNRGITVAVRGKSTEQFMSGEVAYLLSQGCETVENTYDITTVFCDGSAWGQEIGKDDYPVLNGKKVFVTKGCAVYTNEENPGTEEHDTDDDGVCTKCGKYIISTEDQLYAFAEKVNDGDITLDAVLDNDIKVTKDSWTPIGTDDCGYNGVFDGQGHIISGLKAADTDAEFGGLFGLVKKEGNICNVGVEDSVFAGEYSGSICGVNLGTINNCYGTGEVSGDCAGGICGLSYSGAINNCYSTGEVSGDYAGGICAVNEYNMIINCYSAGEVSGETTGGICGENEGYIITISNCFYNSDIYSTDNGYGTGLTTLQMTSADALETMGFGSAWSKTAADTVNKKAFYPDLAVFENDSPSVAYSAELVLKSTDAAPVYGDELNFTIDAKVKFGDAEEFTSLTGGCAASDFEIYLGNKKVGTVKADNGKLTASVSGDVDAGTNTFTLKYTGSKYDFFAGINGIATVTVADNRQPYIKGDDGKMGWDVISDEIKNAKDGDTVTVEMNGATVVPGNIFDDIKGRNVTAVFDMGDGITWTVKGKSVTADNVKDIDFSVKTGVKTIPVDVVNNVTGERTNLQISLGYEGKFGFEAVLSINLDKKNVGLFANLFYYNTSNGKLEFICADKIADDGTAELTFTHASDYVIVLDTKAMNGNGEHETAGADTGDEAPLWIALVGSAGLAALCVRRKKYICDVK